MKCVLNADHFISLVRMQTKSVIANLFGGPACIQMRICPLLALSNLARTVYGEEEVNFQNILTLIQIQGEAERALRKL